MLAFFSGISYLQYDLNVDCVGFRVNLFALDLSTIFNDFNFLMMVFSLDLFSSFRAYKTALMVKAVLL